MILYLLIFFKSGAIQKRILVAFILGIIGVIPCLIKYIKPLLFKVLAFNSLSSRYIFLLFLFSSLSYFMLIGFTIPSLLIVSSPQEFSFLDTYTSPLYFVFNTAVQCLGVFIFWPLCLYFLLSKKHRKFLVFFIIGFLPAALCNVFLFPGNYGTISLALDFSRSIDHSKFQIILNLLLTVILFFSTLLLIRYLSKQIIMALTFVLISLCGISFYNIAIIQTAFKEFTGYYSLHLESEKIEPIFHLSTKGKNIVIIMLDRAISAFLPYVFEESPELHTMYSGFTYYPNTVSLSGHTAYGAPPIFGGYESSPQRINERIDAPLKQKHNEALLMLPRIFSDMNYEITVTDMPNANYQSIPDMSIFNTIPNLNAYITDSAYTKIWLNEHFNLPSASDILKRNILYYSIFRVVPYALRESIYMQGDWCSPIANHSLRSTINGYAVLSYLPLLTDFSAAKENTITIFVNNTTHEVSLFQASDYIPATVITDYGSSQFNKSAEYHTNAAAIKRLGEWFLYLKENSAYDNTRIIIVSDHGDATLKITKTALPFILDKFNPLLMVKDFNASGSLTTDTAFMSNADVPSIALKNLTENPVNPFTGNYISTDDKRHPLYIAVSGTSRLDLADAVQIKLDPRQDYYVHDNIFNSENWEKAEQ
jgi:hypothetical protein